MSTPRSRGLMRFRVSDSRSVEERFQEKYIPEPMSGCWLWIASVNACGYGTVRAYQKPMLAHRVAYLLYRGEIPEDTCVLHTCDNPPCVNPEHLFLGTPMDNVTDMERKNRSYHPAGENHGRAKLTADDVRLIRNDLRSRRIIAKEYGVSGFLISAVKKRKIWKNVI